MMVDNPVLTKPCFDRNIKSGKLKDTPEAAVIVFQGDDNQAPSPIAIKDLEKERTLRIFGESHQNLTKKEKELVFQEKAETRGYGFLMV